MHSFFFLVLVAGLLLLIDAYLLQGVRVALKKYKWVHKRSFVFLFWLFCVGMQVGLLTCIYVKIGMGLRAAFLMFFFVSQVGKLCFLPFLLIDDLRRWTLKRKKADQPVDQPAKLEEHTNITRSEFLMKAGMAATALPIVGLGVGMVTNIGLFDYRVRRVNLYLPNLPKKFDGLRLGQISDIHSGSYRKNHRVAIRGGVDMLLAERPDIIFFTGDLVNDLAKDINWVYDIFEKIKAPLGVYSCLGNHDYGDYSQLTGQPRAQNRADMLRIHQNYKWDLLLNENRRLKVDGEEIGILGCENWGMLSRFPKYGKMEQTVKNTDDLPVKLLLSHDPSHWRAEIVPKYPQIDAMFSGHTHGMQFGVRTDNFQLSPIEFLYSEWAGLYREAQQQIYVNVGYGFVGYRGRIGILPEITIFTLKAGTDPLSKVS